MDNFLRLIFLLPMIVLMFFVDLRDRPNRVFKGSDIAIVDPRGTWKSAAKLPSERYDFGGTVLNNSFYIVGGLVLPTPWLPTARVDAYDAVTKRWKQIRDYPRVVHHPAVTACDGHLYVVGGYWLRIIPSKFVYMYDESSDTWIRRADLPVARAALGAACISGKIYAARGEAGGKQLTRLDVYDTKTDTWETKAPMHAAREHFSLVSANNHLFALGGLITDRFHTLSANEMYDPNTDTWVNRAPIPHDIAGFSAAVLGDRIYMFGGLRGDTTSNEVFEYNITDDAWIRKKNIPKALYGLAAGTIQGAIHVIGGNDKVKGIFISQDHNIFVP